MRFDLRKGDERLAAFVTPDDPAVDRLLKAASEVMRAAGRSGLITSYWEGPRSRAWEIMAAVRSAVLARGLSYAVSPASFERTGQKVRLPSDIEAAGLATCLDTALLFAACFGQAGLHPMVVFTEGHAFAGAWLQPPHLPAMTTDDPQMLRKALALDELVLFETTLAAGDHAVAFSRTVTDAGRRLAEERDGEPSSIRLCHSTLPTSPLPGRPPHRPRTTGPRPARRLRP